VELKNKKIFITGADGFIGSHLVENLLLENCEITALVNYNSFNSWGWLDSLPKNIVSNIEVISGDIRDANCIRNASKNAEVIFHLAALIAIPYSYLAPESYIDTNVKGTLNILQAARDFNIEKVLITSTSEVYGTAKYVPINELHPKQGQSPYSGTKIAADHLAESFYRSFGIPVTIVRPFNTYGPRQSARAVIPTIITQLLTGNTEIKLGSIHPTRDLLFVKDTTQGFIEIAKSDKCLGEEVNIATSSEITIGDLASKIIELINPEAKIICAEERLRPEKSEVERLYGCNKKIQSLTNWKQNYTLDVGLEETINWFKNPINLANYKAHIYNV